MTNDKRRMFTCEPSLVWKIRFRGWVTCIELGCDYRTFTAISGGYRS